MILELSTQFQIINDIILEPKSHVFLLTLVLIPFVIFFIEWILRSSRMYKMADNLPHPPVSKLPIIGHAHHFIGGPNRFTKTITTMFKTKTPGTVWLGHRLFYGLSNPEDIEIVMNSPNCLAKDDLYRFTEKMFGLCIFNSPVCKWRTNRKMINPAFNKRILDNFVEVFAEQAVVFGDKLDEFHNNSYFDIKQMCENYTLDILCETSMGVNLHAQSSDCTLGKDMSLGLEIIMTRAFNVLLHSDFIFNLLPISKKLQETCNSVSNFTKNIIQEKKAEYKIKMQEKLLEAEINEKNTRQTFLDLLIELQANGANLNEKDLLAETTLFIIAGSDTSATTLSFIMVMLGMFPEYQQKVYEEVIENVGSDRSVEHSDLPKLTYTEQFIKETMRLFPVGPIVVRKVEEDTDLGHCVLPKGAGLVLGILCVHRKAELYPDPLKFDPERFSADEISKRHPYAYLPFSGGPRNCIGLKYAMMSMKTLVATIVRRFHIETSYKKIEDIEIDQVIMIRALKGYPIKVIRRST